MPEVDHDVRSRLPAAVYDLAMRLGAAPDDGRSDVRFTQSGRMLRSITSKTWMAFTAIQTISTQRCDFEWRARVGPLGMILVSDAIRDGNGALTVKALDFIPLVKAAPSAALTRGELMRYLAEIAMAPDAILHNTKLRWRVDGADTPVVCAGLGEIACEVVLTLNGDGRIASTFAPDRPRSVTAPFLPTPWRGTFSDYRQHRGKWVPFAGEVSWEIDGKEVVYWQGRIREWEMPSALSIAID